LQTYRKSPAIPKLNNSLSGVYIYFKLGNNMTLLYLTEALKDAAKAEKNVNYIGEGDIYSLNSLPDIDYSVVFLTQNNHSVNENFIDFGYTIFYVDRLTDNQDNKLKIQSDGIQHIINILNRFSYDEDVDVMYPVSFQPFNQRFADECSGVYASIKIRVDQSNGICEF
jgi:hypothetical protein